MVRIVGVFRRPDAGLIFHMAAADGPPHDAMQHCLPLGSSGLGCRGRVHRDVESCGEVSFHHDAPAPEGREACRDDRDVVLAQGSALKL